MAKYPVHVPRYLHRPYAGNDPAKMRKALQYANLAERLERHLNSEFEKLGKESQIFTYGRIAFDLKLDAKEVEKVLYGVDAGGNGLTIVRGD